MDLEKTYYCTVCMCQPFDPVYLWLQSTLGIVQVEENGRTALHIASSEGHLEIVKILVNHLLPSAKPNNVNTIENRIAHQKLLTFVNATDDDNRTALLDACEKGHCEVARYLVNNSSDVSIADFSGRNPLHVACG